MERGDEQRVAGRGRGRGRVRGRAVADEVAVGEARGGRGRSQGRGRALADDVAEARGRRRGRGPRRCLLFKWVLLLLLSDYLLHFNNFHLSCYLFLLLFYFMYLLFCSTPELDPVPPVPESGSSGTG